MKGHGVNERSEEIVELPDDDAGIVDIINFNSKRLYRQYFGTQRKRKLAIDVTCFVVACFTISNYGEALSV